MEQIQEIEKEEAVRARKELFEQRKQQKNKIVQLAGQVATVSMVSGVWGWVKGETLAQLYIDILFLLLLFWAYIRTFSFLYSMRSGMIMISSSLVSSRPGQNQRYFTSLWSSLLAQKRGSLKLQQRLKV